MVPHAPSEHPLSPLSPSRAFVYLLFFVVVITCRACQPKPRLILYFSDQVRDSSAGCQILRVDTSRHQFKVVFYRFELRAQPAHSRLV